MPLQIVGACSRNSNTKIRKLLITKVNTFNAKSTGGTASRRKHHCPNVWDSGFPFTCSPKYLEIVHYSLEKLDSLPTDFEKVREEALHFALARGSRSGRVAWQFARDWSGRSKLREA